MNRVKEKIMVSMIAVLLSVLAGNIPFALAAKETWITLETKHVRLFFQSDAAVKKFDEKIVLEASTASLDQLFSVKEKSGNALQLVRKVDGLFERVQEILDMRKSMDKVDIHVYANKRSLQEAYNKFQRGKCRIRAWYVFEENSIYVSAADINAGMLGHELAHAVIDHFLEVKPPKATAEILARYVDRHIDD